MSVRVCCWVPLIVLLGVAPASADLVTFTFGGTMSDDRGGAWQRGDRVEGFYQFETATRGVVPSDGIGRRYDAIVAFAVSVGTGTMVGSSGSISVHLDHDGESGYDAVLRQGVPAFSAAAAFATAGAVPTWDIVLTLFEITGSHPLVRDESIQRRAPRLRNVTSATGTLMSGGESYGFSIDRFETVTAVPEPATGLLLAGALTALAGVGRMRPRRPDAA